MYVRSHFQKFTQHVFICLLIFSRHCIKYNLVNTILGSFPLSIWRYGCLKVIILTFALQFLSRRIFVDFTSLCKILGAAASWRYSKPLAAPIAIATRVSQVMFTPKIPSKQFLKLPLGMYSNTSSLSACFPLNSEQ